jgi:hypothetical protein
MDDLSRNEYTILKHSLGNEGKSIFCIKMKKQKMKKEGKKEGKRLAKSKPQFIRNHDS